MKMTLLLSTIMMAGLFLLLFVGVALIQDNKYFTTAPRDIYDSGYKLKEDDRLINLVTCSFERHNVRLFVVLKIEY